MYSDGWLIMTPYDTPDPHLEFDPWAGDAPLTADERPTPHAARLSVILATDTYETIRPVIAHLHRQTVKNQLEIVIVAPMEGHRDLDDHETAGFAGVRMVELTSPLPLAAARANGVRAASAPLVFIGETHTYPHPNWAEALLEAFEHPWAAVVPAISNANPSGVLSWAAYFSAYGRWGEGRPAGEIPDPLIYNTAYRRSVLLELGERLDYALDPNTEELWPRLHARGHRAAFEPNARIAHVNVARLESYCDEMFLVGLVVGTHRALRWPWWRRALYVLGSPFIPAVLVGRLLGTVRRARHLQQLPPGILPAIVAGAVIKAAGELMGYAGVAPYSAEARLTRIELHKVTYAARRVRQRAAPGHVRRAPGPLTSSSDRPVRVAVLGCGTIAYWTHLRTLRAMAGATLVAAADPDPSARARAARLTQVPLYARHDEVLHRDDVDAVVVCAPTGFHADLAIAAANARKHFYLEKPIAINAEEARRVLQAATTAGVMSAMGFNFRLHPVHERARAFIAQGRIGSVRAIHTVFCEPVLPDAMPIWKQHRESGGGVLLDLASHHIDLLRWFLNDEVTTVEAHIGSLETEQDMARVALTTRNGVEVQSYFTFRGGPADYLEFIGERGTLRIDRYRSTLTLQVRRLFGYGVRSAWWMPTGQIVALRVRRLVHPAYDPSFHRALAAFVGLVRGRPTVTPSLDDGARSLAVVLAAEDSAQQRAPVAVSAL